MENKSSRKSYATRTRYMGQNDPMHAAPVLVFINDAFWDDPGHQLFTWNESLFVTYTWNDVCVAKHSSFENESIRIWRNTITLWCLQISRQLKLTIKRIQIRQDLHKQDRKNKTKVGFQYKHVNTFVCICRKSLQIAKNCSAYVPQVIQFMGQHSQLIISRIIYNIFFVQI